ncbi:MAG: hypothetical protein A3H71_02855 [Candidatus Sungbacteria bacterium RIFCSPLOWO2_02_FULL_48_13b]|uniref:Amino acid transporter transmembrane domain-containing protein n=2 Tax=Candidatus Sungiibacteriota TaxID=1817917 RepID=A0A1G2LGG3_9BACT|nr:MAG: hypothetical protein A3C12_01730 [Candidatus Sungbacteria bacterium RIFCSPHIGHO2_02_FULL_49_20]OHA09891.1 MAG: hypothetical protein A3H71_02855 [Candidatus Sungbacteria bacterium RIFCSPLOWO2_02_FULL_48_13b]
MWSRYLQGLALFVGTIIGVGVFTLPFAITRIGLFGGLILLGLLAIAMLIVHLMYGDAIASTPGRHRLPGYAERYLGRGWGAFATISNLVLLNGALLVYVLLGSQFLASLVQLIFPGFSLGASLAVFFGVGAVIFFFDGAFSTEIEESLTILLVLTFALVIGWGLTRGHIAGMGEAAWGNPLLPYGAILFSLAGAVVLPRVYETLQADHRRFRSLVILGTLIPAMLYGLFVVAVWAASPAGPSQEAILGMQPLLGHWIVALGGVVGFLATITSYIGVGLTYKGLLRFDFGLPRLIVWVLATVPPFLLIAAGLANFVAIIGFLGAISVGFDNIVIIRLWHALPRRQFLNFWPGWASVALVLVFIVGMAAALLVFMGR